MDTGLCCYLNGLDTSEAVMNSSISGALFETFVVSEILKSYWYNREIPFVYFYRSFDNNKEIDLLIDKGGKVWPIEIKLTSSSELRMARYFKVLDLKTKGMGAVICTADKFMPMNGDVMTIPVSYI